MKKNDTLKKHHFWILFGLVPLFVLIAVMVVTSSVGAEIDKKMADYNAAKQSISGKTPKSQKLVDILLERIGDLKKKQTSLHEQNWDRQKALFTWPNSEKLKAIERMNLKFGDPFPDDNFTYAEFKKPEIYLAEFSNDDPQTKRPATKGMALSVAPTEFRGGWRSILRHVNKWEQSNPTPNQIWLMMEDIWVQRSLLGAVKSVNEQMAAFQRVKLVDANNIPIDDPSAKSTINNPRHRRFESRTWAVELELKTKDNKQVLTGKLINLTNRLQLMGLNNTMILNVWLDKGKEARPFEFRIGGEFLAGQGAMKLGKVKVRDKSGNVLKDKDGKDVEEEKLVPANVLEIIETQEHFIPPTFGSVTEIVRVEQKFDTRTVPIRRIEAMQLGKADSRHAGSQLVPPGFLMPKEGETPTVAPPTGGGTGGSSGGPPAGVVAGGASGSNNAPQVTPFGGGSLEAVVDNNKNRYIDVKKAVRRMPVGIVVLVDQSLMQDVLLAFANTPLRFQITQVTWKRFRGDLTGTGSAGTSGTGEYGGDIVGSGTGDLSGDLRGSGGSSLGPPPMGGVATPGGSSLGPRPPGGGGGGPTNPYQPSTPTGGLTTVSESQLTSGLVELSIYGVVSIYEKYSPEQDAEAKEKEAKDKEAKEKEAKDKEAKDKEGKDNEGKEKPIDGDPKKGTDPMTPDPKGSKMRRRVRSRGE